MNRAAREALVRDLARTLAERDVVDADPDDLTVEWPDRVDDQWPTLDGRPFDARPREARRALREVDQRRADSSDTVRKMRREMANLGVYTEALPDREDRDPTVRLLMQPATDISTPKLDHLITTEAARAANREAMRRHRMTLEERLEELRDKHLERAEELGILPPAGHVTRARWDE